MLPQSDAKNYLALTHHSGHSVQGQPNSTHDLTFAEFSFAKNNFLACIERAVTSTSS